MVENMNKFRMCPSPPQIDAGILERLSLCETGTFGHFLDEGFLRPGIRQQCPGSRIAGTAVTVRSPFPDSVVGHYALKFIRPGDILLIDRGDNREVSCWGGTTSLAAAKLGLTGLIMDGAGNDITEANNAGLPIWCDGVTPVTTKYRGIGGAINVPISCGGVTVRPGDAVLADENGVLVLPRDGLLEAIEECEAFSEKERSFRKLYDGEAPYPCYPDLTGATGLFEDGI